MGGQPPESVSAPMGAVFLSYASQDGEAAERICEALRSAAIEVWFDQSELRGGDVWDQKIRREIHDCALFIPVISANTASRHEGYFRLEWDLADQRSHMMARSRVFVVPVCLDATTEAAADVPDSFKRVQWTRLPAGETPPAFVERIRRLLSPERPSAARPPASAASAGGSAILEPGRASWWSKPAAWIACASVLLAALAYFAARDFRVAKQATPAAATAAGAVSANIATPPHSIAVLPFVDLSENRDQEYFSDGLSAELIDLLARVPNLRVPARTSSFYFKGRSDDLATIAQKLHVANLLEGSVRRSGGTLRVTVELIRADSGYHLWSNSYDRDLKDVFKVQDDIAAEVVAALKLKLSPEAQSAAGHRTANTDAYDQYLLGREFLDLGTPDGLERATAAYRKAVALDAGYSAAYAGLALAEYSRANDIGDALGFDRANSAADKAVALAPDQADGYAARGFLRYIFSWDWSGAQADLEQALAINGKNSTTVSFYGELLSVLGRQAQAIAYARKATELDPLSARAWLGLGERLTDSGDYAAADAVLARSLELNSQSPYAIMALEKLRLLESRAPEALATARECRHVTVRLLGIATAEHSLGHTRESQAALDELIEKRVQDPYQVAEVYAWRGEKDKAFAWLQRAYLQRDGGLSHYVRTDRLLASLRSDSRYAELLRQMHLPQ